MFKLRFHDDQSHIITLKSLKMADVDPAAKFKTNINLLNLFANLKIANVNDLKLQKSNFSLVISFTPNLKIKRFVRYLTNDTDLISLEESRSHQPRTLNHSLFLISKS